MGRRHVDVLRSLIDAYRECEVANEMVLRTRMELYEVSSVANAMQTGDPSKSQLDRIVQRADCHLRNLKAARKAQREQRTRTRGEVHTTERFRHLDQRWRRDDELDQEMTQLHEMLEEFLNLPQLDREACRATALRDAAWHDDLSVVRKFVEQGAKGKDAALVTAAGMGHVEVAMLLLGSGANAHATSEENGFSVILQYVAFNGDDAEQDPSTFLKMTAFLLSHGADLDDELFSAMNPDISEETYDACVACFEQWRKQRGHTPLVEVPVEVFRRGADAVKTYFAEWEASQTVFVRSKICVVGPSTWGKLA